MDEREFLFGSGPEDLRARREVKVRIPVDFLLRLHGIKLIAGGGVSETVIKALDEYFDSLTKNGVHVADTRADA